MDAPFIFKTMKRYLSLSFLLSSLLLVSSCREELKSCSGHIKEMTDSTMVVVTGGADVEFDIHGVRYDNGLVMVGDSVGVHYVGDLRSRKARAALVRLVPQPRIVDAAFDPSKELETREEPVSDEEREAAEKFIRESRKHGH